MADLERPVRRDCSHPRWFPAGLRLLRHRINAVLVEIQPCETGYPVGRPPLVRAVQYPPRRIVAAAPGRRRQAQPGRNPLGTGRFWPMALLRLAHVAWATPHSPRRAVGQKRHGRGRGELCDSF